MLEVVYVDIGTEKPVTPDDPLPVLPHIPAGSMVILGGCAPIWRYGLMLHRLHGSAARVVAVYDPKLGGAVIVASHHPDWKEGQVVPFDPEDRPAESGA